MFKRKQEAIPVVEVGLSILSLCLAFVFFGSPQMFDRLPSTYEFFKALAPEWGWAIFFLVAASLKLLGIATKQRNIRKAGLIGSTIIYGLIAAAYYLGTGLFSIGFFTYAVLSFIALFSVREVDFLNGE
ncbi:hypothetical protein BN1080_02063 [Planococcus massiliensis]|uniref:Uncharacterized protein n=1 Tax=Planococcus massiliensis TaxID=1499687 RepID=A0A098ELC8_9BACL|nr:hypothetical protein [Planococcus massiliensis]CEG23119.1 hypothetical protein BN1080_02063 [Planococcus massiliensis]